VDHILDETVGGFSPERREITFKRTEGFMTKITLMSTASHEVRVHVFDPQPRGELWVHDHQQSFFSLMVSGECHHTVWWDEADMVACPEPTRRGLGRFARCRPDLADDAAVDEAAVPLESFTRGPDGRFTPLGAQRRMRPVLRHRRAASGAPDLLFLHRDAFHTIECVAGAASPTVTLVVRSKARKQAPTVFGVAPGDQLPGADEAEVPLCSADDRAREAMGVLRSAMRAARRREDAARFWPSDDER
jgi:hypothetical protein